MATAIANKRPKLQDTLKLSTEDKKHVAEFNLLRDLLRFRTEEVVNKSQNGLVVHGPPGVGKTVTVKRMLARLGCKSDYREGVCTARGLFDILHANQTGVTVLDDMGHLLHDRAANQVLLAALGGEIGQSRDIKWSKFGSDGSGDCIDYSGGVIAISNETLPNTALCRALRSRVVCMEFNPTFVERRAMLRDYANQGFRGEKGDMQPEECRAVVEFVFEQVKVLKRDLGVEQPLDFRTITRAYGSYLSRKASKNNLKITWQHAVLSDLRSAPAFTVVEPSSKKGQLELERIAFLKAHADNAKLPKSDQLSVVELAKELGIGHTKAYGFLKSE